MNCRKHRFVVATALIFLVFAVARAGEMKSELKFEKSKPKQLATMFTTYGHRGQQVIFTDGEDLRFRVPAGIEKMEQTGVSSHFALAGDAEVSCSFEVIDLPEPSAGYGAGVGVAFELSANRGWAEIQRFRKVKGGDVFIFSSKVKGKGGAMEVDEYKPVPTSAKWGRMTMQRLKKEVVFLAAEEEGELKEIGRLPFSDQTIRPVRLYADTGGSPTAIDIRLGSLIVRAEEITSGKPKLGTEPSKWWWLLAGVPPVGLLAFWLWRRATTGEKTESNPGRNPVLKKT